MIKNARKDWVKKNEVYYPTAEHIVETNREIVDRDISKIEKVLQQSNVTKKERGFLEKLLVKKNGLLSMEECISVEREGEKWYRRKDKYFNLDYDVLTD